MAADSGRRRSGQVCCLAAGRNLKKWRRIGLAAMQGSECGILLC